MKMTLLILLTGLSFFSPVTQATPECEAFKKTIPADWDQGYLDVPVDWSPGARGQRLKIFYYGNWNQHPSKTPFVVLHGGPGGNSWGVHRRWQLAQESKNFPGIFFDQRGNGCSSPYPTQLPSSRSEALALRHWGASSILKDAEALRNVLIGPTRMWNVFGTSYGSLLAYRYVADYPRSLKNVYAHGFAFLRDPSDYRKLYREHFLIGARQFFNQFPDLAKAVSTVFHKQTSLVCAPGMACPYSIIPEDLIPLFSQPEHYHEIYAKLRDIIIASATQTVISLVPEAPITETPMTGRSAAIQVVARFDYANPKYNAFDPYTCLPAMNELFNEWSGAPALLLYTNTFQCEGRWPNSEELRQWITEPKPTGLDIERWASQLSQNSRLKFFLYSGRTDLASPPSYYNDSRRLMGHRIFYKELTGGHGDFFSNKTLWNDFSEGLH